MIHIHRIKNRKTIRKIYKLLQKIEMMESVQDIDMMTGYIIGTIEAEVKAGHIKRSQGDAYERIAYTINEECRDGYDQNDVIEMLDE